MKLSILVPTLPEPESVKYLTRLKDVLGPQLNKYSGEVEMYIHDAGRQMPTGTKRNEMIKHTDSDYFCMIDCDDWVPTDYVERILRAIESGPDVITFNGYMTTDGVLRRNFVIRLGEKYEERNGVYYRYPNHLCIFKRKLVEHIKFPAIWVQEDYQWATTIRDKGILKTEVHIDADMYHYDFKSKKASKPHTGKEIVSRANQSAGRTNIRRRFLR
jgi:glycosyltransferase involved in cell wall biosynthesis